MTPASGEWMACMHLGGYWSTDAGKGSHGRAATSGAVRPHRRSFPLGGAGKHSGFQA
jgi:hypothetical protein